MKIKCKKCGMEKQDYHFQFIERGGVLTLNSRTCRKCSSNDSKTRYKLRLVHAKPKDSKCQCCEIVSDRLHLDHCHKTDKFRGWICEACNTGIGKLGDDVDGLLRALKYLIKTTLIRITKKQKLTFLTITKLF